MHVLAVLAARAPAPEVLARFVHNPPAFLDRLEDQLKILLGVLGSSHIAPHRQQPRPDRRGDALHRYLYAV
jgi:hypothetical protein